MRHRGSFGAGCEGESSSRPGATRHKAVAARRRIGSVGAMDAIARDLKYAWTVLRRERGFTAAAILALALGIGATTAVFSVVYGVLLRPLPYPDADRLVRIYEEHPGAPRPPGEPETSNITLNAWS